ncbi:MAG TPA: cob(I)yrinic acid a,c-diamide adenosyltransferase [Bdellovibrionota bacterium]|nr:cob(I)yrinic acid a,c-diamide adenosyltransferase [Bdellovibrionota bacterium]
MVKIYTKMGDKGTSRLFTGEEVSKDSPYLKAYGCVDELNSVLGVAITFSDDEELNSLLTDLQNKLFQLGSDLATPLDSKKSIKRIEEGDVMALEKLIDKYEEELKPLKNFILPGGVAASSYLQLARTVCRRAERESTPLYNQGKMNPVVFKYLNRLSDLLFVLSRIVNERKGASEIIWK